jgi:SAM-dependent methyltransferase
LTAHPGALAFDHAVDVYEEARPEYPEEAIRWLAERLELGPGRTVLDLGAGTGKLTRRLVATGARVIAVEPLPAMRARLEQLVPDAEALDGSAEAIPAADGSVDVVTVGQAFHWFRLDDALPELHRVLRPGGALALLWNMRADGQLEEKLGAILRPLRGETPAHTTTGWRQRVETSGVFGPFEEHEFRWEEQLDAERIVRRALSVSFVAALPAERREQVVRQVRAAFAGVPEPIVSPQRTEVFISVRQTETS